MNYYAAVTRKMPSGESFYPEQSMTRIEALRAYTINNAYTAFEEDIKGSIEPGKLADLVVLSKNLLIIPDDEIPGTEVLMTISGGKVVFRK